MKDRGDIQSHSNNYIERECLTLILYYEIKWFLNLKRYEIWYYVMYRERITW